MKSLGRGCGTCKGVRFVNIPEIQDSCSTIIDRRISCDRGLPVCLNCARTNRQCQGYDVRLSWPRTNDRKRAMVGETPMRIEANGIYPLRIVNTFNSDIEIHFRMTIDGFDSRPVIPTPLSWSPITSEADYNLLQFCKSIITIPNTSAHLYSRRPRFQLPYRCSSKQ
jgi:hypothetical protein